MGLLWGIHCLLAVGERRGWEALQFVVGEVQLSPTTRTSSGARTQYRYSTARMDKIDQLTCRSLTNGARDVNPLNYESVSTT